MKSVHSFGSLSFRIAELRWRRIPYLDLYAVLYFLFDPFRLVETETCKALMIYQCTESCLKNYLSTCINMYRSFPGEMSSLETDLADLQNFLIKQSQVRSYENETSLAPWQQCLWTRIRIWSNPEYFILFWSGSGITILKSSSHQDSRPDQTLFGIKVGIVNEILLKGGWTRLS